MFRGDGMPNTGKIPRLFHSEIDLKLKLDLPSQAQVIVLTDILHNLVPDSKAPVNTGVFRGER